MRFSHILQPLQQNEQLAHEAGACRQAVVIPAGWGQGRAAYGGLVAALLQTHLQQRQGEGRPLRAAHIAFIGPATVGDAILESRLLRAGKSALQAEVRLLQGDAVIAMLQASFGADRASQLIEPAPLRPAMKAPEDCQALPYIAGLTPEFTQHFDLRWSEGGLPFSGHASPHMKGWIRLRDADDAGTIDPALVLALVDAWPPAVVARCNGPANLSTMTWAVGYRPVNEAVRADGWWAYQADTLSSGDGYAHIRSTLWTPGGEAIAMSQQTVAVFY
ncbi:MAG: thioesterase family protein [Pseudomonadota bacterium]